MNRILVGLDGSKGSRAAAQWAAQQAKQTGAAVVAVHAEPRTELWSMSAFQVDINPFLAEIQDLLDGRWSAALRRSGVEYSTQLVRGDPATELLRAAKRVGASMLVLGSNSHRNIADLIVGSTVHKVINRSTIPVVLVPIMAPVKKKKKKKKAVRTRST